MYVLFSDVRGKMQGLLGLLDELGKTPTLLSFCRVKWNCSGGRVANLQERPEVALPASRCNAH